MLNHELDPFVWGREKNVTDRIFAYTVILEREIRADDAEAIENAIRMVKGVAEVTPQVANASDYFAVETARRELGQKIWEVLYPKSRV
jgi:hypothetical protein